jgi:hypothetical protein
MSPRTSILVRSLILAGALLELLHFMDGVPLALELLAGGGLKWFDLLFALATGIVGPLCAIAAGGLAIANRRLGLAGILLVVAPVIYWSPSIAFAIAVMIYGF